MYNLQILDGLPQQIRHVSILPRTALEALQSLLNGRNEGYVFQGRNNGHISTRQIQRLLDTVAQKAGLQETRPGTMNYLVPVTLIFKPNRKL